MSARDVIARALLDSMALAHRETENGWGNAEVILSALSAAGYAVVPREPTEAMILAAPGRDQQGEEESIYHSIYRAMIAASEPQP